MKLSALDDHEILEGRSMFRAVHAHDVREDCHRALGLMLTAAGSMRSRAYTRL